MIQTFSEKVNHLPKATKKVLFSNSIAEETFKIITSYTQDKTAQSKIAKLVGLTFVKDAPLERMADIIQKELAISESISAGLAAELTKVNFLPIKMYFPNSEALIAAWSKKAAPPAYQSQSLGISIEENPEIDELQELPTQSDIEIKRDIVEMVNDQENILNQNITKNSIKLSDSENLKLPSIRNWLIDYKKYRSNFVNQDFALIRAKYINEAPNTKNLSEEEKTIVSELIKSYDEHNLLPFSQQTGRLMTENLISAEPQKAYQPPSVPLQNPSPTPPLPKKDTFREQVQEEDLAGPQSVQRPTPKLDGNVVNLREFGK